MIILCDAFRAIVFHHCCRIVLPLVACLKVLDEKEVPTGKK